MTTTTYPINEGGKGAAVVVVPDSGTRITRMADGAIRGFSDFSEDIFRLTITHFWMVKADVDSIKGYYAANPNGDHNVLTQLEGTYLATFLNAPSVVQKEAGFMIIVSELIGTKV